jgi:hypothetical protein
MGVGVGQDLVEIVHFHLSFMAGSPGLRDDGSRFLGLLPLAHKEGYGRLETFDRENPSKKINLILSSSCCT